MRDLIKFELVNSTINSECSPYSPIFDIRTNILYTSSLDKLGKLCKWNINTFEVDANLSINAIVSDLDFTDTYLVVSTDKNKRTVHFVHP